jgi:hypothetical protein
VGTAQADTQTAEGTAVVQVKPGVTAAVRRLLAAYGNTLDVLDGLPMAPMVATRWHWWSRPDSPIRLPRISWMLRWLTLWHIDRVLSGAERAFRRRSALGIAEADEADAFDAVTGFRASLPSRSRALRIWAVVVAALVVAHVLATVLVHLSRSRVGASVPLSANINQLLDSTLGALQLTSGSLGPVADALFKASPAVLAATVGLVSLSVYVILWPVASAFRLKRLLLNLYPQADSKLCSVPASWSTTRSTGVYELERETFATLGAAAPSEPPLDLLVSLPLPICWIALWVYDVAFVTVSTAPSPGLLITLILAIIVLLLYIVPAAIRLAWLAAAWRARNGGPRSDWLFGDEISVPWRSKPVRCRSPVLIGWLSLMIPYTCMIIWWPWWSTGRDLRQLGRAYDIGHLRRMHPMAQALAVGAGALLFGLPALIVLSRAPRYVREAQVAAGLQQPVPRSTAWLVLIWPVLCIRLQRQLNRLWQAESTQTGQHDQAMVLAAEPTA